MFGAVKIFDVAAFLTAWMTPTSDWLMTDVGPPDCPTTALPFRFADMMHAFRLEDIIADRAFCCGMIVKPFLRSRELRCIIQHTNGKEKMTQQIPFPKYEEIREVIQLAKKEDLVRVT